MLISLVFSFMLFSSLCSVCSGAWIEDLKVRYNTGNTEIRSVVIGDIYDDGSNETVTGGYYFDGTRYVAELRVLNGTSLNAEKSVSWYINHNTYINSVAIGDIDNDGQNEIVTGGYYFDNYRYCASLRVWTGSTLSLEHEYNWYSTSDTILTSVDIANVDGDGYVEIIAGGYYDDGSCYHAFLCEWQHIATLALERSTTWYWGDDTVVLSIDVGNVDTDGGVEIVTGGYYFDGTRDKSLLQVWSGTLTEERSTNWYWTGNTHINSVAIGNVDTDGAIEIVTGGYYTDAGDCWNSLLYVHNGITLAAERSTNWRWISNTFVASVAVGDCDRDGIVEIVTGGAYFDGSRFNALMHVFRGSNLSQENSKSWYWYDDTFIFSVAVGCLAFDDWLDIVTGGSYFDGTRNNSQLFVWTNLTSAFLSWGTQNYPDYLGGGTERSASDQVSGSLFNLFDGAGSGQYGYCFDGFGVPTYPPSVYYQVGYCESNHANTVVFYKGHIREGGWDCGVANCPYNLHGSVFDNEGTDYEYDQIVDWRIHETDGHVSMLSSLTHDFVFIWACGWGADSRRGGFFGGHTAGMQVSYMGEAGLTGDGYDNPDDSDRCFISFEDASINFSNETDYQGNTYGDWAEEFFRYLIAEKYTIKQALDAATFVTHGIDKFSLCQLYEDVKYTMTINGTDRTSWMRIWGDSSHKLLY